MQTFKKVPANLTIKVKPYLNNIQATLFHKGSIRFTEAMNRDSKIYENRDQKLNLHRFHRLTYHSNRRKYKLKSFMTESAMRLVRGTYQTVDTQRRKQTYDFPDKNYYYYRFSWSKKTHHINTKKIYIWYHCRENGQWIWHRIHFHRLQMYLFHGEDWSVKKVDHQHHMLILSVNTIRKRISKSEAKKKNIKPQKSRTLVKCWVPKYFRKYLNMSHKLNSLRILRNGGKVWFYIGLTLYVKTIKDLRQATDIYGADRGERFIGWIYDSHKHSMVFRGLPHRRKRKHLLKMHSILQRKHNKKHSHSALQKMASHKNTKYGNGYMNDVNNQISKTQVSRMKPYSIIGYENLGDIRPALENASKKHRYTMVSWSFGDYGNDIQYKALLYKDIIFIHVPAANTSQRDPLTGFVAKNHRHHDIHTYYSFKRYSDETPYKFNDDLIGGMNIQFLTTLLCIGYAHPTILKDGRIAYRIYTNKIKTRYITRHLGRVQAIKIYKKFNKSHF